MENMFKFLNEGNTFMNSTTLNCFLSYEVRFEFKTLQQKVTKLFVSTIDDLEKSLKETFQITKGFIEENRLRKRLSSSEIAKKIALLTEILK